MGIFIVKNKAAFKDNWHFLKPIILFIFLFIIILQSAPIIAMFSAIKPLSRSTQQKKIISPIVRQVLRKVPKANLLIFLDDQEVDGPIGSDLLVGLHERRSPIIVSSSLMSTVLKKRSSDNRSPETIMDQLSLANKLLMVQGKSKIEAEMNKRNEPIKASVNMDGDAAILVCKTLFNPDQWIIKKINNNLLLLIPDLYCNSIGVDIKKVKEDSNTSDENTVTELLLGLKVNHLKTITYTEISTSFRSYLSSYIGNFGKLFCSIFK